MTNTIATWRTIKSLHKELGKSGKIVVWTKIFVAPQGFSQQVPYVVAIIAFGKEKRTLQLVDYEEDQLQAGQQVVTVVRRIGSAGSEDVISYGLKAKPV
jgi:uncharacterized OB-fold protein